MTAIIILAALHQNSLWDLTVYYISSVGQDIGVIVTCVKWQACFHLSIWSPVSACIVTHRLIYCWWSKLSFTQFYDQTFSFQSQHQLDKSLSNIFQHAFLANVNFLTSVSSGMPGIKSRQRYDYCISACHKQANWPPSGDINLLIKYICNGAMHHNTCYCCGGFEMQAAQPSF